MSTPPSPFAERVDDAHERFLAAANAGGALTASFAHPLAGPEGEPLHAALAWLGPRDAPRVVAVVSGVHGVEGFAGSAIQIGWLRQHGRAPLPRDTGVLLLHLVNPWGAAWSRRETEDNVDLFRNLAYPAPPFPDNELYTRYEAALNPRAPAGPARAAADRQLEDFIAAHGRQTVIAVVRRGQHRFPKGLTFNGDAPTWSSRLVADIGRGWLARASRVDVLDIHTGFGPRGEALYIPAAAPGTADHRLAETWFGDRLFRPGSDAMIPAHPRAPFDVWGDGAPPRPAVASIGLEFGTETTDDDLDLLRDYSCHANYGSLLSPEGTALRQRFREKFYPADPSWRDRVLEIGIGAVETVLGRASPG